MIVWSVLALGGLVPAEQAWARDDQLAGLNQAMGAIPRERRSDLILLPAIAKIDAPPAPVARDERAAILPASSAAFAAAEAWAMAPNQRAALEALARIAKPGAGGRPLVFALPYGREALESSADELALIRAEMLVDLGDPPLLAAARYQYLPALQRLAVLVHIEATRLAAAGKPMEAIDVVMNWIALGRQLADRPMAAEMQWGLRAMIGGLERVRDIAYADFRSDSPVLTANVVAGVVTRLGEPGIAQTDRMTFPLGDRAGAAQMIEMCYVERGGPNPQTFAPTMARLASTERPLRLFAEAATWQQAAATSRNWFDMNERLTGIFDDWTSRWSTDPFSPRQDLPFVYERTGAGYEALRAVVPNLSGLMNERQVLKTQLIGTRTSLAMVAYVQARKNFPPSLTSLVPGFIPELEPDPFNPARARGARPPLEYFVPNKINYRRLGEREEPKPHSVNVFTPGGEYNFRIGIGDDQFVLYSVGPNKAKDWAENVSGAPERGSIGDVLVWPPALSLYRQHLVERGELK